jgi:hypothetical protein
MGQRSMWKLCVWVNCASSTAQQSLQCGIYWAHAARHVALHAQGHHRRGVPRRCGLQCLCSGAVLMTRRTNSLGSDFMC